MRGKQSCLLTSYTPALAALRDEGLPIVKISVLHLTCNGCFDILNGEM